MTTAPDPGAWTEGAGGWTRRARRRAWALLAAYAATLAGVWLGVSSWASISTVGEVPGAAERAAIFLAMRAAVDGAPVPAVSVVTGFSGWVTLYCAGEPRYSGAVSAERGRGLAGLEALAAASRLGPRDAGGCRLKLDVQTGRGPIYAAVDALFALSLVPGIDGIGVRAGDHEEILLPDELSRRGFFRGYKPIHELDVEVGLDTRSTVRHFAHRLGGDGVTWSRIPHRWFRFRTAGFVESAVPSEAGAPPLPVVRGNAPPPPLTVENLRAAAAAGARYLHAHLHADGRFDYQYDTAADQAIPDGDAYSLPRHAGTTYYLAQAYGGLRDPSLADDAKRALQYLVDHRPDGCDLPDRACVGAPDDRTVDTGSAALALLAAVEYRRATGDARFASWARRVAAFLLSLQRPDGDFCHLYDVATAQRDERTHLLYFSGEAAFALAKYAATEAGSEAGTGADAVRSAVARALDYLDGENYGYFAGGFFFGEDHWTCLAVGESWDALPAASQARHGDFCEGFARFMRRSQFRRGEGMTEATPDLVGGYGFSPFLAPHPTPVGSRTEALLSIRKMALARGHAAEAEAIRGAIVDGLRFLLGRQISAEQGWLMARPEAAIGGFLMTDVQRFVRIDFVQHSCSSLLRASLEGEALLRDPAAR